MYTESTLIIETLIALLFSAFFSGMEIAFVSSSKLRFEMEREQRGFTSRLIDTFYQHPNSFISTLLVGNNIALVIYGILMARLINAYILIPLGIHQELGDCPNEVICLLIQTILSTLIVLVTGEFLPKTLFKLNPNRMMNVFAVPAYIFYIILWPVSKFTSSVSKLLLRIMGQKVKKTKKEKTFKKVDLDYLIQSNIENIEDEKEIEEEIKIFQNALGFSNVKVRDCIVPRTEIDAVEPGVPSHRLERKKASLDVRGELQRLAVVFDLVLDEHFDAVGGDDVADAVYEHFRPYRLGEVVADGVVHDAPQEAAAFLRVEGGQEEEGNLRVDSAHDVSEHEAVHVAHHDVGNDRAERIRSGLKDGYGLFDTFDTNAVVTRQFQFGADHGTDEPLVVYDENLYLGMDFRHFSL